MLRSLVLILCFVLLTYSWAKYVTLYETFELSEIKPKLNWFWSKPNPDHKGSPLVFTGGDAPTYATYMDRFSDPMGYSDYENNFSFEVTFSTLMAKGVLYVDQLEGKGLMFVSLHNGSPRLTFVYNQGPIRSPQVKTISSRVNDLKPHTLKVQRVPGENKVNIQVDDRPSTSYSLTLPSSFRGGINIYIGGIPVALKTYNKVYDEPSFIGCIYKGQVLNKGQLEPFSLYNFVTTGEITSSCHPPTFIRLYGKGPTPSYAETPYPGEPASNFKFSFDFRTSASDGLLFMDMSGKFMYVAMYLKEGYLWLAVNDGGLTAEKVSQEPLNDNQLHEVSVAEAGAISVIWVHVDGHQKGVKFKNRVPFVSGSRIVVGGMPDEAPYNQILEAEKVLFEPLETDILNVTCNGRQLSPAMFKVT